MKTLIRRSLVAGLAGLVAVPVAMAAPAAASGEVGTPRPNTATSAEPYTGHQEKTAQREASLLAYHEETFRGEYVATSGHSCGGKMYKTDATIITPAGPMRQYAWIFRNCGKTSLKRKAIVKADRDGPCYTIPGGRTRTLEVKFIATVIARDPYERSASC